jgi:hypothetical protein
MKALRLESSVSLSKAKCTLPELSLVVVRPFKNFFEAFYK